MNKAEPEPAEILENTALALEEEDQVLREDRAGYEKIYKDDKPFGPAPTLQIGDRDEHGMPGMADFLHSNAISCKDRLDDEADDIEADRIIAENLNMTPEAVREIYAAETALNRSGALGEEMKRRELATPWMGAWVCRELAERRRNTQETIDAELVAEIWIDAIKRWDIPRDLHPEHKRHHPQHKRPPPKKPPTSEERAAMQKAMEKAFEEDERHTEVLIMAELAKDIGAGRDRHRYADDFHHLAYEPPYPGQSKNELMLLLNQADESQMKTLREHLNQIKDPETEKGMAWAFKDMERQKEAERKREEKNMEQRELRRQQDAVRAKEYVMRKQSGADATPQDPPENRRERRERYRWRQIIKMANQCIAAAAGDIDEQNREAHMKTVYKAGGDFLDGTRELLKAIGDAAALKTLDEIIEIKAERKAQREAAENRRR